MLKFPKSDVPTLDLFVHVNYQVQRNDNWDVLGMSNMNPSSIAVVHPTCFDSPIFYGELIITKDGKVSCINNMMAKGDMLNSGTLDGFDCTLQDGSALYSSTYWRPVLIKLESWISDQFKYYQSRQIVNDTSYKNLRLRLFLNRSFFILPDGETVNMVQYDNFNGIDPRKPPSFLKKFNPIRDIVDLTTLHAYGMTRNAVGNISIDTIMEHVIQREGTDFLSTLPIELMEHYLNASPQADTSYKIRNCALFKAMKDVYLLKYLKVVL